MPFTKAINRAFAIVVTSMVCLASFTHALNAQCWLEAQGTQIINAATGEPVILRGVGLGNWLLQEGYMLHPQGCAGCPQTQWQMKLQYLNERLSIDEVEDFYQQWRDNFVTKADIDYLASLGFNCVRLPMHYELFLTDEQRAVRNNVITNLFAGHDAYKLELEAWHQNGELFVDPDVEGFRVIDRLVEWCRDNGMYVVLDMHAAPGAQGTELNICDGFFPNNLWDFPVFPDVLDRLWLSLSDRYKSEPRIAMYEFFNEPNNVPGGGPTIHALTQRLISTVRNNGDNHLICVHGNAFGNFYDFLEPFTFSPNFGLVYSAHRYGIDLNDDFGSPGHPNQINRMVDMINFRNTHNVPIWVGETGENSNAWLTQNITNIESAGIGWCHWTFKRHDVFQNPALMRIGGNYPTDGASIRHVVLNSIRFANCIPNPNTIAAVTSTLPVQGSAGCFDEPETVVPMEMTVFRGELVEGDVTSVTASDDEYARFNPGFTLNNSESPVWVIFSGTLSDIAPNSMALAIESSANTPGLERTIEVLNFDTQQFDVYSQASESFNSDSVVSIELTSNVSDYVFSPTGVVFSRFGWRQTGFTILFPWTASIDHVQWSSQ